MTTPSTLHPKERGSVRATDPITSQWAADSIADATTSQAVVLRAVREYPKGHEFTLANVATLPSGRKARLLTLTEQGRAAA